MTEIKQQFKAELDAMLIRLEAAIVAGDRRDSGELSMAVLAVVRKYAGRLTTADLKEGLNSPTANAIARRLGVQS